MKENVKPQERSESPEGRKLTAEEAVRGLRACTGPMNCKGCPFEGKAILCSQILKADAADVIEDLLARVKELEELVEDRTKDVIYYDEQLKAERQWIPVTERLPESYTPVLVTYLAYITGEPHSDAVACMAEDGGWLWWEGAPGDCDEEVKVAITHWKPLPKGPEVGNGS